MASPRRAQDKREPRRSACSRSSLSSTPPESSRFRGLRSARFVSVHEGGGRFAFVDLGRRVDSGYALRTLKLSISSGDHIKPIGVVFDLDGTLIDSRQDIAAACNHVLVAMGRAPLTVDAIAAFVGDGARMLIARAFAAPPDSTEVDAALALFHPFYESHPAVHTTLMPGARELLDALGDRPLAIVTNKPRKTTLACLDALGVTSRFMAIRAGGDGPLKPDPSGVTSALASMRVDAPHAWMIGDGEQDVIAGRAAGCVTVGVRGGFQEAKLEAAAPDMMVGSLLELITLVRLG